MSAVPASGCYNIKKIYNHEIISNQYKESCLYIGKESHTSNKEDFGVELADKPEMSITRTKYNYQRAINKNLVLLTSAKEIW